MHSHDKDYLLDRLAETHSAIHRLIKGIDLELRVYSESGWRIRDILGHIATWDREVTKSLRAFLTESEYIIPDLDNDETGFNEKAVTEQSTLSTNQIVAEWKQAREDFRTAIKAIPTEKFPGDLLYPWGNESGSITRLVEYMVEHDEEHIGEIEKALGTSQEG
jgi:hypothetical protein